MTKRLLLFIALLLLLPLAGCSSGPSLARPYPVQGKAVLASGQPVPAGRVLFNLKDDPAGLAVSFGDLAADGTFTLTSYQFNDGAVPGEYVVTFEPTQYKTKSGNPVKLTGSPIPQRYLDKSTSDLVVQVKAEDNKVTLQLKQ